MEGVANHASKAYEFSHFLSYLDPVPHQLPIEREGKFILPKPFAHDNVSDLESVVDDQVELFNGIEDEVQLDIDPYPVPTPYPRPNGLKMLLRQL